MLNLAVYIVKARLGEGLINSHWVLHLCARKDQPSISVFNTFHTNRTVTGHFIILTHQPHCNNLPPFTEPEGKGQMELLHIQRTYSLKVYFNINLLHTFTYCSLCLFLLGFPAICLYSPLFASMLVTSPEYLVFLITSVKRFWCFADGASQYNLSN